MSALTGRLLGAAYRVGPLIGEGGMGAVYEAVHEKLGRQVAVKVLHARADLDPGALARFEREARAAAALQHPGIVQVTDFQANPGEPPFIVMERLVGESLRERIRRQGRVPAGEACFIVSQVLDALETAHRAGIVHRDVKPDNVHLTSVGGGVAVAKVLDFGIAKLKNEAPITHNGAMMGSPAYMPPEQALGQPLDARADVYGVGAMAYHAISGKLPIDERAGAGDVLSAILESVPPPLDALVPGLPPGLSAIVARAMAKRADQRFSSAAEMLGALRPFVRVGPQGPEPLALSGLASTTGPPAQHTLPHAPSGPPMAAGWPSGPPAGPPPGPPRPLPPSGPPPGGPPPGPGTAMNAGYGPPTPGGPPPGSSLPGQGGVAWQARTGGVAHAPGLVAAQPAKKRAFGLWLGAGCLGLIVIGGGVAAAAFALRQRDAGASAPPPPSATAPAKVAEWSAPSASAVGPTGPSAGVGPAAPGKSTPPAAPRPSGAPAPTAVDAGQPSGVIDPPPAPVVDAAAPHVGGARSVRYTYMDLGAFDAKSGAMELLRAKVPTFAACAPLACVAANKTREDYRFLDASYSFTVDDQGRVVKVSVVNSVVDGVPISCPSLDACAFQKLRAIAFPKPAGARREGKLFLLFRE